MRLRFLVGAVAAVLWAEEFYVSPNGHPSGDGSIEAPWDLATALAHPKRVKPMDTIWLRGGTYRGRFVSSLKGAENAPIVVRQYPGERAVLDGAEGKGGATLTVNGAWAWFWGFEIMTSNETRRLEVSGSNPPERTATGVVVYGPNTKFINLIVHDNSQGFGFWKPAVDSEIYGCLIYNNGWVGPDRGHGHAIYTQNDTGLKLIRENIMFNQFGNGMQLYGSSAASLKNYRLQGNVHFSDRFLIGGDAPVENVELRENYIYGNDAEFHYTNRANKDLYLLDNYFTNGVHFWWWEKVYARRNIFRRSTQQVVFDVGPIRPGQPQAYGFEENTYISGQNGIIWAWDAEGDYHEELTLRAWREKFGFDLEGVHLLVPEGRPNATHIFVRRNEYEPNRAHIVIYNWRLQDFVDVDVSVMNLRKGDRYELRNAQNYFEEIVTGVYEDKPIRVPMKGWTVAKPIGYDKPIEPATFPEFGVFVLTVTKAQRLSTVSAASYKPPPVAVDSIAASFGDGLAAESRAAAAPLPTELAGTTIRLRDTSGTERLAPLFSVSPRQVNYLIPAQAAIGPALLTVSLRNTVVGDDVVALQRAAPGFFTANGDGRGVPAAQAVRVAADGSQTAVPVFQCGAAPASCVPLPIDLGAASDQVILVLYGTGIRGRRDLASVNVTVGGEPAAVLYAGPQPDYPGLDQVNVRLPRSLAGRGRADVVVSIDNQPANPVTVSIK
jgi:uncharacterized protein (TIGR03437 family)